MNQNDHDYLNNVIEQYILELNSSNQLKKCDKILGFYHSPIIIRNPKTNSLHEVDENISLENQNPPVLGGTIKDAQIKSKRYIGRKLLGYVYMSRGSQNKTIKEGLKPIINELILDVQDKLGEVYNEIPYIGTTFLTFLKNKDGNYFSDLDSSAGYELKYITDCSVNPPEFIYTGSFDPKVALKWNINL